MCLGPKVGIWGLTQGRREQFKFWVQGKNKLIGPQLFFNFYQFPDRFSLTLQHIKNLDRPFSVSAKYGQFSLSTWSKNKNFDFYHIMKFVYL